MAPLPPRIHVAVGTGLLGASLGCTDATVPVNDGPQKREVEEKRVNTQPEPDAKPPHTINEGPQPEPPKPEPPAEPVEPIHVNEGPQPEPPKPEPPPEQLKVNPGPNDATPKIVEG